MNRASQDFYSNDIFLRLASTESANLVAIFKKATCKG